MHEKYKLLFILNEPFFGDNLLLILKGDTEDLRRAETDKVGFLVCLRETEGRGGY